MYEIYQRLLDEKGLKNSDISRLTGISNMTLSDWKRGKSTPKADKMKKIAEVLSVSVDYLLNGTETIIEIDTDFIAELTRNKRLLEYAKRMYNLNRDNQETIFNNIEFLEKKEGRN